MTIDTKYLIVGGGMTGDAAAKGIREHDADGLDHARRLGAASAVRAPAALEEALDGRRRGEDLARDRRDRRRPAARTDDRLGAGRRRDRRPGRRVPLRAAPARDRRPPAAAAGRRGRGRLLPHARRLPAAARPGRAGHELRRDRRRVHRLRDRRRPRAERLRRDDGRPRLGDLRAALPARALGLRHAVLPRQGRRGARRRAGRRRRGRPRAHGVGQGAARRRDRRRARDRARNRARGIDGAHSWTTGSSSTSSAARDGNVWAAGDVASLPASGAGRPSPRRARGPREVPRQGGRREHGRRRAALRRTCRSSTPTCSTSGTRRSATSTRGSARSRTGSSRTARA